MGNARIYIFALKELLHLKHVFLTVLVFLLASCVEPTTPEQAPDTSTKKQTQKTKFPKARTLIDGKSAFARVSRKMLPVAKAACKQIHKPAVNGRCTFRLRIVKEDKRQPSARFTYSGSRPVIEFNENMLRFLRDDNEIAMVLGHEMAHQIGKHIVRNDKEVIISSATTAIRTKAAGGDAEEAAEKAAQNTYVTFSRKLELEADIAGTNLMMRAGYTPDTAINLLDRLPTFSSRLRTHPLHPQRKQAVRSVARQFRAQQKLGKTLPLPF